MPEIGATLREARMRARIDVSEIEAQTKIRAKYLRALENEEWDLLPGPTFVKSFLRTYAHALGLDGKLLVEEYRLSHERPSESELQPIVAGASRARPRPRGGSGGDSGPSRAYAIAVGVVGLVIVLLVVGLLSERGGSSKKQTSDRGSSSGTASSTTSSTHRHARSPAGATGALTRSSLVALSIEPTASVYVCLIGDNGRKAIPGLILKPGAVQSTYHARRFEITLGNSSAKLILDGIPRTVPASSQAIGYSITRAGRRTLPAGQLPTCR
jgi:cytoskeleton protein RodZ